MHNEKNSNFFSIKTPIADRMVESILCYVSKWRKGEIYDEDFSEGVKHEMRIARDMERRNYVLEHSNASGDRLVIQLRQEIHDLRDGLDRAMDRITELEDAQRKEN